MDRWRNKTKHFFCLFILFYECLSIFSWSTSNLHSHQLLSCAYGLFPQWKNSLLSNTSYTLTEREDPVCRSVAVGSVPSVECMTVWWLFGHLWAAQHVVNTALTCPYKVVLVNMLAQSNNLNMWVQYSLFLSSVLVSTKSWGETSASVCRLVLGLYCKMGLS